MATAHLQENLDNYMQEKIKKASLHKVGWSSREDISHRKDMVICQFKKCGIPVTIYGSEDSEIKIVGIEDYQVGESEEEATDDDNDPFEELHD